MAIDDWMPALAANFAEISGLEAVYYPSETDEQATLPAILTVFPCLVLLPERGTQDLSAGGPNTGLHQVRATLYAAAAVLPEAYAVAVPFIRKMTVKLASHIQLGGLVEHVLPAEPWYEGPGGIAYGTTETGQPRRHLGLIFRMEVKENLTTGITVDI